jgi:hypothetical protein
MNRILPLMCLFLGAASWAIAGPVPVVPEPGSFFLLAGGLAAGVLFLRKKRRAK